MRTPLLVLMLVASTAPLASAEDAEEDAIRCEDDVRGLLDEHGVAAETAFCLDRENAACGGETLFVGFELAMCARTHPFA